MSDVGQWLEGRRPAPPPELTDALERALHAHGGPLDSVRRVDLLLESARASLGRTGSVAKGSRESAFDLLVADALVTYACEAALGCDDPGSELGRILGAIAVP